MYRLTLKLSFLPQLKNLESGSKKVFADYQHLVED